MTSPTPMILDKNRKTEEPTKIDADRVEEKESKEEVPMIVHRTYFTDSDGVRQEKVHGPMPVSEWAEYERKHGL